jgi:hypothetical protein
MKSWYAIEDMDRFVEASRVLVYSNFGPNKNDISVENSSIDQLSEEEQEEIKNCLTQSEAVSILQQFIKKRKNKTTRKTEYCVTENSYLNYLESLGSRMVSNMLNNLTNAGLLESAFDSETNDFVFWVKENNNEEQPETD